MRDVMRHSTELKKHATTSLEVGNLVRLLNASERVRGVLDESEPLMGGGADERSTAEMKRCIRLAKECRRLSDSYSDRLAKTISALCRAKAKREAPGSHRRLVWERQADFYGAETEDDEDQ
jgi:hypothetical protein